MVTDATETHFSTSCFLQEVNGLSAASASSGRHVPDCPQDKPDPAHGRAWPLGCKLLPSASRTLIRNIQVTLVLNSLSDPVMKLASPHLARTVACHVLLPYLQLPLPCLQLLNYLLSTILWPARQAPCMRRKVVHDAFTCKPRHRRMYLLVSTANDTAAARPIPAARQLGSSADNFLHLLVLATCLVSSNTMLTSLQQPTHSQNVTCLSPPPEPSLCATQSSPASTHELSKWRSRPTYSRLPCFTPSCPGPARSATGRQSRPPCSHPPSQPPTRACPRRPLQRSSLHC